MNELLKGKKTYFCAALGALYCAGAYLGFYSFNVEFLSFLGFGTVAALRSALVEVLLHAKAASQLSGLLTSDTASGSPLPTIQGENAKSGTQVINTAALSVVAWIVTSITGALAMLAVILCLVGCKSSTLEQGGAYAPAVITISTNASGVISTNIVVTSAPDRALFEVDSAFDLAYSTVNAAFETERKNREFLWEVNPEIKHALDRIRPQAADAVRRFGIARAAYLRSPNPAGLSTLQTILNQVQAFASGAQASLATANEITDLLPGSTAK